MKGKPARTRASLRDSKGRPLKPYLIRWQDEQWGSFEISVGRSYVSKNECLDHIEEYLDIADHMGFPDTSAEVVPEGQWTLKDLWKPDHCRHEDIEGLCREYEDMASEVDEEDEEYDDWP